MGVGCPRMAGATPVEVPTEGDFFPRWLPCAPSTSRRPAWPLCSRSIRVRRGEGAIGLHLDEGFPQHRENPEAETAGRRNHQIGAPRTIAPGRLGGPARRAPARRYPASKIALVPTWSPRVRASTPPAEQFPWAITCGEGPAPAAGVLRIGPR